MVNITIVSGFLGAGKTTLLRQLIVHSLQRGERSVVIENEFGAVGLDADILARTGITVHELNQGCICCTLQADFITTLDAILASPTPPDRIFFEPSGIFIPDSILEIIRGADFRSRCRLDNFIAVVDAVHLGKRIGKAMFQDFFRHQSACADHFALSKTAGLDGAQLAAIIDILREMNARAGVQVFDREATSAAILDYLTGRGPAVPMDLSARGSQAAGGKAAGEAEAAAPAEDKSPVRRFVPLGDNGDRQGAEASGTAPAGKPRFLLRTKSGHGLDMAAYPFSGPLEADGLRTLLEALRSGQHGQIIRAKGRALAGGCWHDFSLVEESLDIVPVPAADAAATDTVSAGPAGEAEPMDPDWGHAVVIGQNLAKETIRALVLSLSSGGRSPA